MSSSNVVFVCDTGRMFHTENKTLVLEWPTFTDVYSFTVAYSAKNIGAYNMHKQILKYIQILAVKNQAKLIAK